MNDKTRPSAPSGRNPLSRLWKWWRSLGLCAFCRKNSVMFSCTCRCYECYCKLRDEGERRLEEREHQRLVRAMREAIKAEYKSNHHGPRLD